MRSLACQREAGERARPVQRKHKRAHICIFYINIYVYITSHVYAYMYDHCIPCCLRGLASPFRSIERASEAARIVAFTP